MEFDTVISHFGTQQKAAIALGVNQSSVAAWKKAGIPVCRQYQIQVITGGVLQVSSQASVTPSEDSAPH